ncbi:MAG: DHH family phosphoesterase, partial [Candidatus Omnitrophota bacterium]
MDELEFLKKYRSFLITGHLSPDGDAIGSEIALALFLQETGKKAIIVNDEPVPANYRFLSGSEIIQTIKNFKQRSPKKEPFEAAILLECSSKNRAGQTGKLVGKKPILNIDHHFDNTLYGDVNLVRFKVSACGEIIYDLIRKARGTITEEIASALYTAVLTDTSSFRFHARTRTFRIVADLTDKKADPDRIFEKVYEQVSFPTLLLLSKSLSTITRAFGGVVTYCRVDR